MPSWWNSRLNCNILSSHTKHASCQLRKLRTATVLSAAKPQTLPLPSHLLLLSNLCGWNPFGPLFRYRNTVDSLWVTCPRIRLVHELERTGVNPGLRELYIQVFYLLKEVCGFCFSFSLVVIRDLVRSPASHWEENFSYCLRVVITKFPWKCYLPCTQWAFAILNCMCIEVKESTGGG